MSSWIEPQYESHPNPPYLHPLDVPDGGMRGADHPPSLPTSYSYTPRPSPNSSRQTYSSGLYGPRPQPSHAEPIQGLPTPGMAPPAMAELEEADDEYMEVEPVADSGPIYRSDYDDEPRLQKKRTFVGGFIRSLKKLPRVVRRGFTTDQREVLTPPGLAYYQSPYRSPYIDDTAPYVDDAEPQETEETEAAPPYDAPSDHVEGDWGYTDAISMPAEFRSSTSPSLTPSQNLRAPRSESQLTYDSLTNPPARHVSQHGSLHHSQRSSPRRTVRNPDPPSPTEGSGTVNANSPRFEQPPLEPELEPSPTTSHLSQLTPARRPTVTVQSPTGSPIYIPHSDDYAGMDMDSPIEHSPEPEEPSQFTRIAKFFRDLNNLPWVSRNVTVDFDPTDAERERYEHAQGSGKSWYTGHLQDLDLTGGDSSRRRLTAPSGHSLGHAPGSSATLAPFHGSGSVSSNEGASAHLPAAPIPPSYPYPVQTLALPPHPFYLYPYTAIPQQQQQQQQEQEQEQEQKQQPLERAPEQLSPQSSGNSDVPRQPFLYVVAMPPGYMPGPVDPSRPMQFGPPYTSHV